MRPKVSKKATLGVKSSSVVAITLFLSTLTSFLAPENDSDVEDAEDKTWKRLQKKSETEFTSFILFKIFFRQTQERSNSRQLPTDAHCPRASLSIREARVVVGVSVHDEPQAREAFRAASLRACSSSKPR